jgi:hypothetical protein
MPWATDSASTGAIWQERQTFHFPHVARQSLFMAVFGMRMIVT